MVEVIAFGENPSHILSLLRSMIDDVRILVYPEFFDSKRLLLNRNYRAYICRLIEQRDRIIVAVWPDYYHSLLPRALEHIVFVYPLHSIRELDFVLKVSDHFDIMLGFPNKPELRDYTLESFLDAARTYGFRTWLLGLKRRFTKHLHNFYGTDVTPSSCGLYKQVLNGKVKEYIGFARKLLYKTMDNMTRVLDLFCTGEG